MIDGYWARPSETGSREPGLASRPGPPGFDPARLAMAEKLCRSRAGAKAGYFCKPGEGAEAAFRYGKRWAPKLGSEIVTLERHHYYATRQEAVAAAREWKRLWRERLDAIAMDAAKPLRREAGSTRKGDSAVGAAETPNHSQEHRQPPVSE